MALSLIISISDKTKLKQSREVVEQALKVFVSDGKKIINDRNLTLEELKKERNEWEDYIRLSIKKSLHEVDCFYNPIFFTTTGRSETDKIADEKDKMKNVINDLESIINRLGLLDRLTVWGKLLYSIKRTIEFLADKLPINKII